LLFLIPTTTSLQQVCDRSGQAGKYFLTSEVTIKRTTVQNVQAVPIVQGADPGSMFTSFPERGERVQGSMS
jgi:hypothetical protein